MAHKILIIEDEVKVANFLKKGLIENNYDVVVSNDGREGCQIALNNYFDLLILDIGLPGINGFELCKQLRNVNTKLPILILSALSKTDDKLIGFDLGADDYLVKPFNYNELLARIKVLIKRANQQNLETNILKIADLELNLNSKIAIRSGNNIDLTAKEFSLLEYLMRNEGKVISRSEISEKIWDIKFDTGTNVIDVYVNFIRKKIDKDYSTKLIHTVIGMGYMFGVLDKK